MAGNRNSIYRDLLNGTNQEVLVRVATETFVNVVAEAATCGLIEVADAPEFQPLELTHTRSLFSKRFPAAGPEEGEVGYRSLAHEMRQRGVRADEIFTQRVQLIPNLYDVLIAHRNILAHSHVDSGSIAQITGLAGTVLSIIELAPPATRGTEQIKQQCEEAIAYISDRAARAREQDVGETQKPTVAAPRAASSSETLPVESPASDRNPTSPHPVLTLREPLREQRKETDSLQDVLGKV